MTTIGGGRFGEWDDCGGRLDGGVEVGRGGIFGIVVRIVGYRGLCHLCGNAVKVGRGVWGKTKRKQRRGGKKMG
jgi:hypothetical protein